LSKQKAKKAIMKISLAKALKEKNKVVSKIKELEGKIQQNNVTVKGNEFSYTVPVLLTALEKEKNKLVALKAEIFKANLPIYKDILELSEAKAHLSFLRGLNVQEGIVVERYNDKEVTYVAQINLVKRDAIVEEYQTKVDTLQETIDTFNYSTQIEVDL
jgi:hypothetical protein